MATTDLISLTEAKTELGITVSDHDTRLSALITNTSSRILAHLQNSVVIQARTERHYGGKKRIYLQRYPVTSGPTISDEAGNTVESTDYLMLAEQGMLQHVGFWPTAQDADGKVSRWVIVYGAGLAVNTAAVPADLKEACLLWVSRRFSRPDQSVTSKRVGDLALGYAAPSEEPEGVPADIAAMLAPYVSQGA
jgi:hypothetical protein